MRDNLRIALLLLLGFPGACFAGATDAQSMRVDAYIQHVPKKALLEFKATNLSGTRVCLEKGNLPWGTIYSTSIIALLPGMAQKQLERAWIIDDPPLATTCFNPGETLTGSINLSEAFPALGESLKKGEVVIFWYYQNKQFKSTAGGYFVLPRKVPE